VAIAVVGPASAQSTVSGDKVEAVEAQINAPVSRNKLEALEAQINALQQELRDLKGKVNKTEQTAQKAYAANPPMYWTPVFVHTPGIPSMAQTDGRFEGVILATAVGAVGAGGAALGGDNLNCIALTSRLHVDVGGYDYRPNVLFDPHHPTIPWTVPSMTLNEKVRGPCARWRRQRRQQLGFIISRLPRSGAWGSTSKWACVESS
jgi:hypothetical protein